MTKIEFYLGLDERSIEPELDQSAEEPTGHSHEEVQHSQQRKLQAETGDRQIAS